MRKEAKARQNTQLVKGNCTTYHATNSYSINYAFQGFEKNLYFTSDRAMTLDAHFNRQDGKALKGFGLEIETGWKYSTSTRDEMASNIVANIVANNLYPLFPKNLFKMQDDCTITGVEIISQVMTKEFIRNHYPDFKAFWEALPMFAMTTDDGKCGMHVNLSNGLFGTTEEKQALAIRKLYYIINKHYNLMCVCFNRDVTRTQWSGRMQYDKDYVKNMNLYGMSGSHNNCFNGSHYPEGRVEVRLVGGQKNFPCFRNTMEVVFHLIEVSKSISWDDCDDVVKIFSGCNKYVWDRLNDNCKRAGVIDIDTLANIQSTVDRAVSYI